MGIIHCKKHGKQGFIEVCEHIHDEYKNDIYHKPRRFTSGNLYFIEVCDICWQKYDLDRFQHFSEISLDEFLDLDNEKAKSLKDEWRNVYDSVNRRGWCVQCIAEVKVKQARRNNEPLPFPVFEKTLTENQRELVEELKKNLLETFHFQKSVRCLIPYENFPAVFVQTGAFTYPLSIKIYYILAEKEQNEIIEFVKTFIQQTELSQARIAFWEAESWIKTENRFGLYSYHQGEEKLLREVYLNC